jgi:hypothetical protein
MRLPELDPSFPIATAAVKALEDLGIVLSRRSVPVNPQQTAALILTMGVHKALGPPHGTTIL